MPIIDYNTDFCPAFRPVLYEITGADPDEATEVAVYANDILQGTKRYRGASVYSVNIAPYLQGCFRVEPLNAGGWLRKTTAQRCVSAAVGYAGERTTARLTTAGIEAVPAGSWLFDGPCRRRLKATELDEVSFVGLGNLSAHVELVTRQQFRFEFDTDALLSSNDMVTLCVSGAEVDTYLRGLSGLGLSFDDLYSIRATVMAGSTAYLPSVVWLADRVPTGVRMQWINRLGAIDCYTFRGTHTAQEKTSKDRVQLGAGWWQAGAETTTEHTVFSDFENDDTLRWVAGVVSAPRVWADGVEVVVTSDAAGILCAAPGQIELAYTEKQTLRMQTL